MEFIFLNEWGGVRDQCDTHSLINLELCYAFHIRALLLNIFMVSIYIWQLYLFQLVLLRCFLCCWLLKRVIASLINKCWVLVLCMDRAVYVLHGYVFLYGLGHMNLLVGWARHAPDHRVLECHLIQLGHPIELGLGWGPYKA